MKISGVGNTLESYTALLLGEDPYHTFENVLVVRRVSPVLAALFESAYPTSALDEEAPWARCRRSSRWLPSTRCPPSMSTTCCRSPSTSSATRPSLPSAPNLSPSDPSSVAAADRRLPLRQARCRGSAGCVRARGARRAAVHPGIHTHPRRVSRTRDQLVDEREDGDCQNGAPSSLLTSDNGCLATLITLLRFPRPAANTPRSCFPFH